MALSRRIVAEGLGTAFLLAAAVGSGIMGEKLSGGNIGIALLANALYSYWRVEWSTGVVNQLDPHLPGPN
jgi:glycerol uptake facilitator-like aquaporin